MINKIFALPVVEQLTPVLSRRQLDELELIVVDHPQVKASVAFQGAHLLSWKPAGEEESAVAQQQYAIQKRRGPARRRAGLLAVVRPGGATGFTVPWLRPQPAVGAERPR
ncbi:Putative glucose-6-phosphate 1-epimerase [Raoultella planticola]|uniref:Glucose-6-phosphate 1-epimerase n=1 Tax=Raoultella planticola TaxID=575 RepID=A0A485CFQ3_RAOPL|nr:Putative glucose-6-phosphate 1-epimerase [Raoultella planticola]